MAVMIQVRNVPDDRPTKEQILARIASREPVRLRESIVDALRAEREGR
jgi:hypothetical protein